MAKRLVRDLLESWRLYHRPERQIHLAAWQFQQSSITRFDLGAEDRRRLAELNRASRRLKSEIATLVKECNACRDCQGECCSGQYNHFTPIDYLLQLDSDHPLEGWGEIWEPASVPGVILDLFRARESNDQKSESSTRIYSKSSDPDGCPDLGYLGCNLAPEDRPIRCVIWTCRALRDQFSTEIFHRIGRANVALAKIVSRVVRIAQSAQVKPT